MNNLREVKMASIAEIAGIDETGLAALLRRVEARVAKMSEKLNEHIQKNGSSKELKKKSEIYLADQEK